MALKDAIGADALFAGKMFNIQAREWLDHAGPIADFTIESDTSEGMIHISDCTVSCNDGIVNINDASVGYTASAIEPPYYLAIDLDGNINNPFENIFELSSLPAGSSIGGSAESLSVSETLMIGMDPAGYVPKNDIKFSKNTSSDTCSFTVEEDMDSSLSNGISLPIMISNELSNIDQMSIILDESLSLTSYSQYDFSVQDSTNHTYINYNCNFSAPDSEVGAPSFQDIKRIILSITTSDSADVIDYVRIANIRKILKNPTTKAVDDGINFIITASEGCANIAVFDGSVWEKCYALELPIISADIGTHIANEYVHIPLQSGVVLDIVKPDTANRLITIDDTDGMLVDSEMQAVAVAKAAIRCSDTPIRRHVKSIGNTVINSDTIKRGHQFGTVDGANSSIDSTATTSKFGFGFYYSDSSASNILTTQILDVPGELSNMLVAVDVIDTDSLGITYDVILDSTSVLTNLNVNTEYNISDIYTDFGIYGTRMKLKFNIPGDAGGDYWVSKQAHPTAGIGNRLCKASGGELISIIKDTNSRYLYEQNSWVSKRPPSLPINSSTPHPAATPLGIRIVPINDLKGELYVLSNDSWMTVRGQGFQDGRTVEFGGDEFFVIRSDEVTRMSDMTDTVTTMTGIGDGWKNGAVGYGAGIMIASGGDSISNPPYTDATKIYGFQDNTWSVSTPSPNSISLSGYATAGKGSMYTIGGTMDLSLSDANNEFNITNETWTTMASMGSATSMPSCGTSRKQTIISSGGELAGSIETDATFEYVPDKALKFIGFSLKAGFFSVAPDADHIGIWVADDAPRFLRATDEEIASSGFWTDDDGMIYGGIGTYWGYFGIWAANDAVTYDLATDDEKWQNGYWTDTDGKLGTDIGPRWDK